ncbi:MAG: hypothetical protein KC592_17910 [Nitrospira sp.]|nr:hypothetical protein [Nitrospira sp.]
MQVVPIGGHSSSTHGAIVLSQGYTRGFSAKNQVGRNCLIGLNPIILPGVDIGDEVVVGAGAVAKGAVRSNSLVVEYPAPVVGYSRANTYRRIIKKM